MLGADLASQVAAASTTNAWLIENTGHTVRHWDGAVWSAPAPLSTSATIRDTWARAGNDAYAVGDLGTVLHWDGATWALVDAIGRREIGPALRMLAEAYDPRDRGLPLLGAIAWSVRQLWKFCLAIEGGADIIRSYANATSAYVVGGELELRKELVFAGRGLHGLSLGSNLTLLYSRVDLSQTAGAQTDPDRPMQAEEAEHQRQGRRHVVHLEEERGGHGATERIDLFNEVTFANSPN